MRTIKSIVKEVTDRQNMCDYYVVEVEYAEFVFDTYEAATDFAFEAFMQGTEDVRITLTRVIPEENESTQVEEGE